MDIQLIEACVLEKWNPLALGCKVYGTAKTTCVLCQLYNYSLCDLYPIAKRTGAIFCHKTPYDNYAQNETRDEELDAIEAEIEFLISLLPETHIWRN